MVEVEVGGVPLGSSGLQVLYGGVVRSRVLSTLGFAAVSFTP
jgi:hypothetical protein